MESGKDPFFLRPHLRSTEMTLLFINLLLLLLLLSSSLTNTLTWHLVRKLQGHVTRYKQHIENSDVFGNGSTDSGVEASAISTTSQTSRPIGPTSLSSAGLTMVQVVHLNQGL